MLIENGGQFFDVFRAKHPDRYGYSVLLNIKINYDVLVSSGKLNDIDT